MEDLYDDLGFLPMYISDSADSDDTGDNVIMHDHLMLDDDDEHLVIFVSESDEDDLTVGLDHLHHHHHHHHHHHDETDTDYEDEPIWNIVDEESNNADAVANGEHGDIVANNRSESVIVNNDQSVVAYDESNYGANTESYDVVIHGEPNNVIANNELPNVVVNNDPQNVIINNESQNVIVNNDPQNVANNEPLNLVANNELPNTVVNNGPESGTGNNGPESGTGNNGPETGTGNNGPETGTGNNGPESGLGNNGPESGVGNNGPENGSGNNEPNDAPPKEIAAKDDGEVEKASKANTSYEEDGMMCTICFEPWTCSGEHRLVSLRCGHLFGRCCIAKWVKNRDAKCPQCNARARKSEIRPIYAKSIKTLDTSERDWAVKELEKEAMKRKRAELEAARKKLECEMIRQEMEGLKRELMYTQVQLKDARTGQKGLAKLAESNRFGQKAFSRILQVDMKLGGCRVMDCSSILGMLAVSQPSLNSIFRGYGLRKISVPDVMLCEFVHVHQKQIKDVSFHSTDGLILSASLDKTVKIVNFLTNSIVQTYNLDCDVWSCSWDLDDPKYFYAGVKTGFVYVYDIRMTDRQLCQLPGSEERSPVVSLQYLKRQPSAKHSKCGPIIGQLGSCCFYEKAPATSPFTYASNPLPLEGKFTSLSCESTTGHLLASCRPSLKHPKVTHTLCELAYDMNVFSCNFVHGMTGGSMQAQLTRSKLMLHPDNDSTVLVCAGDEESKSTLVWNGCTGSLLDKLPADSPTLDVATFRWDKPVLATLTDKNVYFYNWNSN